MKVWAYIHPELNILCCALLKEAIPTEVKPIELDVESTDDVVFDGIQIRLKTEEEKLQEEKQKKLNELKSLAQSIFSKTDYVVTKIAEAQILELATVADLKKQYANVLQQRQEIRQIIASLKDRINKATTLEEVRAINIYSELAKYM